MSGPELFARIEIEGHAVRCPATYVRGTGNRRRWEIQAEVRYRANAFGVTRGGRYCKVCGFS
jgi:hypothetical protein